MKTFYCFFAGILLSFSVTAYGNYQADPEDHGFMDQLPAEFYDYSGHPNTIYWPHTNNQATHLKIYGPDTHQALINKIFQAYIQGGRIIENLFEVDNPPVVRIYLVKEINQPNVFAQARIAEGIEVILIEDGPYTEHSFLHEYMHTMQHVSGASPGLGLLGALTYNITGAGRWFVEGPPQFAPLITGAPNSWIDKELLYSNGGTKGRFLQAIRQAHGKSLVDRQELASLFWYYYFKKVHGGNQNKLRDAIRSYKDNGFKNEGMDWFNFKDYWHDFALSHVNKPGDKTGVWENLDSNFSIVKGSALRNAEIVEFPTPFGDTVEMSPLSQKYFLVERLDKAEGYVIFSLPDKSIPEGIEISAVLRRTDTSEETWETIFLDKNALGKHWSKRFPRQGEKHLENDAEIPYDKILFVVSNYNDEETLKIKPIITNHFANKYEGRGVELDSGLKYVMTGSSILGKARKGDGYRLVINEDELHTRALEMWFQRVPQIEFKDNDDKMNAKVLMYVRDNGKFRGDVYFKYIATKPEKVEKVGSRSVETGKIVLKRERKKNFYDTPNRFKMTLDQEDLLIMFGADVKAAAVFTKMIEDVVKTKYKKGTFGNNLSQLFLQTIALDTRAYDEDYETTYKRGRDDKGHYLKIKLAGDKMWFTLRETELAGFQKIIK